MNAKPKTKNASSALRCSGRVLLQRLDYYESVMWKIARTEFEDPEEYQRMIAKALFTSDNELPPLKENTKVSHGA